MVIPFCNWPPKVSHWNLVVLEDNISSVKLIISLSIIRLLKSRLRTFGVVQDNISPTVILVPFDTDHD